MPDMTPENATTNCVIYGDINDTIDGSTGTRAIIDTYQQCTIEWTWGSPIHVYLFSLFTGNFDIQGNYITGIWYQQAGEWVLKWSGQNHIAPNIWVAFGYTSPDVTGIKIKIATEDRVGYINEIRVSWLPTPCSDYQTQSECETHGCYWWNGACHDSLPTCEQLNNQSDCEIFGCYWWNGACHDSGPTCEQLNNQNDCARYGCFWWNEACHSISPFCDELNNQNDCERYGCYWWNGACHTDPQPTECSDYTTPSECEAHGCYWWNGYCHDISPSCTELNNQSDCERYGCFWWNGACHTDPQPTECSEYVTQSECEAHGCYWWPWLGECRDYDYLCEDIPEQVFCEAQGCYWYNNSCHSEPPVECSQYFTQEECTAAGCYWYDDACHSEPQEGLNPYLIAAAVIGIAAAGIGTVVYIKRRKR